jgi:hypothetical protein
VLEFLLTLQEVKKMFYDYFKRDHIVIRAQMCLSPPDLSKHFRCLDKPDGKWHYCFKYSCGGKMYA